MEVVQAGYENKARIQEDGEANSNASSCVRHGVAQSQIRRPWH